MVETYQICPYTGLRSFTEEESLYFKGREEDIDQATAQLQRNKFLMLTGASGDGKSSLVYAGIIPNARSGFLKSTYSPWCVADFRPERTPFKNLVSVIAKQLDIPNTHSVEAELNHGFSALVDLYKNSKRFIDTASAEWLQADDAQKSAMRRNAANLVILVDQFEEFFTNPENYHQGAPSKEANLVLNILLETTRIALEEDLPIYVIFTMRSDYIGQCAAFRGLPEYIGFSQFFVPRLNRSQLQQVIEEPASLSGNQISRRLTERLIHDLTEGGDQLPILQHALNQIWVAASEGNEEMDLLHYAMVGGMPEQELPEEQVAIFKKWFDGLPDKIKSCYHEPSLQNVLDTHTNKLYEEAAGYYTEKTGKPITREEAQHIIRTTFTCLTKIDQGRAVRNRMTLYEITNIIGLPGIEPAKVGAVLNIFREPGNTFIRPFINPEAPESLALLPAQVLDITHESLIRNWLYLGEWAKEEFDNYSISQDFEQQLGRWVNSGKSDDFLLPIGPLTYFETWYNKVKPNQWWIARYLPDEGKAGEILQNGKEFLANSAGKHVITRTIMRYGPKRIAGILGLIALGILGVFGINTYLSRQNGAVLKNIRQQTLSLAADPKIKLDNKVTLIVEAIRKNQLILSAALLANKKPVDQVNLANGIATLLLLQGKDQPQELIMQTLKFTDSMLTALPIPETDLVQLEAILKEINDFRVVLEFANYNLPGLLTDELRTRNVQRSAQWAMYVAKKQPHGFRQIQQFSLALENALNYAAYSQEEINTLLGLLSPFENLSPSAWITENFNRDKILLKGELGYGLPFNGLYQDIAYLYAAGGNTAKALQCVDSVLKYSQVFYQGDYGSFIDNAANIAFVFASNNQLAAMNSFVKGYIDRRKMPEEEFYARWIGRTIHERSTNSNLELYFWMDNYTNLNLQFSSLQQLSFIYNKYREVVQESIGDPDRKNLLTAVSYKNQGVQVAMAKDKPVEGLPDTKKCFDLAFDFYRKVSPAYLLQPTSIITTTATDNTILPAKTLFIYPDFRTPFHPVEPRSYFYFYFSEAFMDYVLQNNLFDELYGSQADLGNINNWLHDYNVKMFFPHGFLINKTSTAVFAKLEQELKRRHADSMIDLNFLYLYLGMDYQLSGKTADMVYCYKMLNTKTLVNSLKVNEFGGNPSNHAFRLIANAVYALTKTGHFEEAKSIISSFKLPMNRSSLYAYSAVTASYEKQDGKLVQQFIDSAKVEMNRAENVTAGQPNRPLVAFALAMQSPEKNAAEISMLIKNIPQKSPALRNTCRSYAFNGKLFEAVDNIPESISANDQAEFLGNILYDFHENDDKEQPQWATFNQYYRPFIIRFIQYVDENN